MTEARGAEATEPLVPASLGRQGLAIAADYMLFASLVHLLSLLQPLLMAAGARFVLFVLFEGALFPRGLSPGCYLLGIQRAEGLSSSGPILGVEARLVRRGAFPALLLGFWFLAQGLHWILRWSTWNPALPIFGRGLREYPSMIVEAVIGLVCLYLAAVWLRLKRRALPVTGVFIAASAVSIAMSGDYWSAYAADWVIQHRQFFGLPADDVAVQAMQQAIPGFFYLTLAVQAVLVLFAGKSLGGDKRQAAGDK